MLGLAAHNLQPTLKGSAYNLFLKGSAYNLFLKGSAGKYLCPD
jgi:hypothetical protein